MYIIKITDNGGKTYDRYCVYLRDYARPGMGKGCDNLEVWVLELSENCDSPQGVSMFDEYPCKLWKVEEDSYPHEVILTTSDDETEIQWDDLPVNIRLHIAGRLLFGA